MTLPDNLFTSLTFCPTYARTFQLLAHAPVTFAALTACVFIPFLAIALPLHFLVIQPLHEDPTQTGFVIYVVTLVIRFAFYITFVLVGKGAIMQAVSEIYAGNAPTWLACIKTTIHRLPTLLYYTLLLGIVVFVTAILTGGLYYAMTSNPDNMALLIFGIVIMVICGIWLAFLWISVFCAMPSIMVEKETAIGSIKRSYGLTIGNRCYIIGATVLLMAATFAAIFVLGPVGALINIILFPVHAILAMVVYLNLRVRKDGLDRERLARDLDLEAEIEVPEVGVGGDDDKEPEGEII